MTLTFECGQGKGVGEVHSLADTDFKDEPTEQQAMYHLDSMQDFIKKVCSKSPYKVHIERERERERESLKKVCSKSPYKVHIEREREREREPQESVLPEPL